MSVRLSMLISGNNHLHTFVRQSYSRSQGGYAACARGFLNVGRHPR